MLPLRFASKFLSLLRHLGPRQQCTLSLFCFCQVLQSLSYCVLSNRVRGGNGGPVRVLLECSVRCSNTTRLMFRRFPARCQWTELTCSRPAPCAYVRTGGFEMQAGATNFLAVLQSMFPRLKLPQASMMRNCGEQQLIQVCDLSL